MVQVLRSQIANHTERASFGQCDPANAGQRHRGPGSVANVAVYWGTPSWWYGGRRIPWDWKEVTDVRIGLNLKADAQYGSAQDLTLDIEYRLSMSDDWDLQGTAFNRIIPAVGADHIFLSIPGNLLDKNSLITLSFKFDGIGYGKFVVVKDLFLEYTSDL